LRPRPASAREFPAGQAADAFSDPRQAERGEHAVDAPRLRVVGPLAEHQRQTQPGEGVVEHRPKRLTPDAPAPRGFAQHHPELGGVADPLQRGNAEAVAGRALVDAPGAMAGARGAVVAAGA